MTTAIAFSFPFGLRAVFHCFSLVLFMLNVSYPLIVHLVKVNLLQVQLCSSLYSTVLVFVAYLHAMSLSTGVLVGELVRNPSTLSPRLRQSSLGCARLPVAECFSARNFIWYDVV